MKEKNLSHGDQWNLRGLHFIYGQLIQQGQWGISLQDALAPTDE